MEIKERSFCATPSELYNRVGANIKTAAALWLLRYMDFIGFI